MSRFSEFMDYVCIKSDTKNEDSPEESDYAKRLAGEGNRYAAAIIAEGGSEMRTFPPNEGIDAAVAKRLKSWAKNRRIKGDKYALIDWDRTISCVEGFVPDAIQPESIDKEFLDDVFTYLIRRDRIDLLRSLFRELKESGVNIHILTNNPGASVDSPYRGLFLEMISRLFNEDDSREEEYDLEENGAHIHIVQSSSKLVSMVDKTEQNSMLHATVDYTLPGELLQKSTMVCHVVPGIRNCAKPKTRKRPPMTSFFI